MSGDEDDKATVVIDLNALKKQKKNKENELNDVASSLEFAVDTSDKIQKPAAQTPVLLFDFSQGFFEKLKSSLPSSLPLTFVKSLPELNDWLKKKTPLIVVFGFDANPKAANQLCAQLKAKFKHVYTVIVANNLSDKKVQVHKASPAGAAAYVKAPFTAGEMEKVLQGLLKKMAS
jgi:DNA-binding NtrC family response regulator